MKEKLYETIEFLNQQGIYIFTHKKQYFRAINIPFQREGECLTYSYMGVDGITADEEWELFHSNKFQHLTFEKRMEYLMKIVKNSEEFLKPESLWQIDVL